MNKERKQHGQRGICLLVCVMMCLLWSNVQGVAVVYGATVPSITATTGIVIEASTGRVLYSKDADTRMVPASMTKVMTTYIVFEEIAAGRLSFDTQITITAKQASLSTNTNYQATVPLVSGASYTVDHLLKLIFLPSASASCIVLAEHIAGTETAFVERMNATAEKLNVNATYSNCHGAFVHYISARGQARLVQVFLQEFPEVLKYTSLQSVYHNGKTYTNTNGLLSGYYYSGADGFKTGTTTAAGRCLTATAERDGVRIISVIFNASSDANRHYDSIKLLNYGFEVMAEESTYFHDTQYDVLSQDAFERLRSMGVNLQSESGWVRPTEIMTEGEFATTFLSAMNAVNAKLTTQSTTSSSAVWDLRGYFGASEILKGLNYGVLSLKSDNSFSPDYELTQSYIDSVFLSATQRLGIAMPDLTSPSLEPEWTPPSYDLDLTPPTQEQNTPEEVPPIVTPEEPTTPPSMADPSGSHVTLPTVSGNQVIPPETPDVSIPTVPTQPEESHSLLLQDTIQTIFACLPFPWELIEAFQGGSSLGARSLDEEEVLEEVWSVPYARSATLTRGNAVLQIEAFLKACGYIW